MAVAAHEPAFIVRTAVPVCPVAFLMAAEANAVVFFRSARQIFRAKWNDAAHAAPASRLHVRRAGAVTIFAIELALLRLADLAHERAAERFNLVCVAGRANLCSYIGGIHGSGWLGPPRDRAFARCRLFRWRRRLRRAIQSTQKIEQVVGLRQFRQVLSGRRPIYVNALCKSPKRRVRRIHCLALVDVFWILVRAAGRFGTTVDQLNIVTERRKTVIPTSRFDSLCRRSEEDHRKQKERNGCGQFSQSMTELKAKAIIYEEPPIRPRERTPTRDCRKHLNPTPSNYSR